MAAAMPGVETITEVAVQAEVKGTAAEAAGKASVAVVVEEVDAAASEAVAVVAADTGVWTPMWDKAMEEVAWSIRSMNMARL